MHPDSQFSDMQYAVYMCNMETHTAIHYSFQRLTNYKNRARLYQVNQLLRYSTTSENMKKKGKFNSQCSNTHTFAIPFHCYETGESLCDQKSLSLVFKSCF